MKTVHGVEIPEKPVLQMPKDILEKWIAALRSGEYSQTADWLHNPDTGGYCCLGVAQMCTDGDVEADSENDGTLPSVEWYDSKGISGYTDDDAGLADVVIHKAYYISKDGTTTARWVNGVTREYVPAISLATLNDGGDHSFEQIADIIEAITETY